MSFSKRLTAGCLSFMLLFGSGAVLPDGLFSGLDTSIAASAATGSYKDEVFRGSGTENTGYNLYCRASKYDNNSYDNVPVIDITGGRAYFGNRYDWNTMSRNGVKHVLFYLGESDSTSKTFKVRSINNYSPYISTWVNGARNAGIKVGIIWQGYPLNAIYVRGEAAHVYNCIKNLTLDLPVFYSAEIRTGNVTTATNSIRAFYTDLRNNGYKGNIGLYVNGGADGTIFNARSIYNTYKNNICIWSSAYDNYGWSNPNLDDILNMHQYTGNYGIVPARGSVNIDGLTYTKYGAVDISMAFPARPSNTAQIYTSGNTVSWSSVANVDGYRLYLTDINGNISTVDCKSTSYTVSGSDIVKVVVKTLKADKFGFTAESTGVSTPSSWHRVSMSSCTVTLPSYSYAWTGDLIKPTPKVTYKGKVLKANVDYTVSYSNNINAGTSTAQVTVKGKGVYSGSTVKSFSIKGRYLSSSNITLPYSSYKYTGNAIKPKPVVKYGTKTLRKGTDYTVTYKNNTDPGKATVVVKGLGQYMNTVSKTFTIVPLNMKAKLSHNVPYAYKKEYGREPAVTVTSIVKGKTVTLTKNVDYTVSYKNNKAIGNKAQVIVTGKGKYTGASKTVYFTITPSVFSFALSDVSGSKIKVSNITSSFNDKSSVFDPSVTTTLCDTKIQYADNASFNNAKTVAIGKNAAAKTISDSKMFTSGKMIYVRVVMTVNCGGSTHTINSSVKVIRKS